MGTYIVNERFAMRPLPGLFAAVLAAAPMIGPAAAQRPEAVQILEDACKAGDLLSCANLAVLYRHGRGVSQDYARALELSVRVCEGGVEFGCGYAGEMTYQGLGIAANTEQGEKLMRRACANGDQWACQALTRHGLALPAGGAQGGS